MNAQPCELCGHVGDDVEVALAWYRLGLGVQDTNRCTDVDACKRRVAAKGERWPLLEPGERLQPDVENGAELA
jgi:hypothetical protein